MRVGYYLGEMQPKTDAQLLRDYAEHSTEAAFTELVQRHTNLVYSAALRQVESPEVAAEIAQNVFIGLARSAKSLSPGLAEEASLSGWLCRCARNLSLNHRRDEFRRLTRERHAMEQALAPSDEAPDWEKLRHVLDDAMFELSEVDYDALVLRFYQNQDFRTVGAAIGATDDSAQKRVSRALDKLRELLAKRGIRTTAAALSAVISANAIQAAPAGLAVTISTAAVLSGTTLATTATATATTAIAMTTLQKAIVTTTVAVLAGAGIYKASQTAQLRDQVQALQQQQLPLVGQIEQLQRERDDGHALLATLRSENEQLKSNQNITELLKLRGEVARLRAAQQQAAQNKAAGLDANDPAIQNFLAVKEQAQRIGRYLGQMPDKAIPELKFLTDVDWLTVTKEAKFDTDADIRKTLSHLRSLAKNRMPLGGSLLDFTREHDGQLPDDIAQLKPYFKAALDTSDDPTVDAILNRYKLAYTGRLADLPQESWVIVEKSPVDKDYDTRAKFGAGTSRITATGIGEAGDPEDKTY